MMASRHDQPSPLSGGAHSGFSRLSSEWSASQPPMTWCSKSFQNAVARAAFPLLLPAVVGSDPSPAWPGFVPAIHVSVAP